MNRRVLLVCQYYYPSNAPGAHRCAKLAKYLPEFGWEPTVLCMQATPGNCEGTYDPKLEASDTCEVVRVPYTHPKERSPAKYLHDRVLRPCLKTYIPYRLYRRMLKRGRKLAREQQFDAIWATSPSPMILNVARRISRSTGIPWIADMRDLAGETDSKPGIFMRWEMALERRAASGAAAFITVTQHLADMLARHHDAPVRVIPNGFDPDDFPPGAQPSREQFEIVYCGVIYSGRDPTPLFDALDLLLQQGVDIGRLRVRFYGVLETSLDPLTAGHPCVHLVENMGRVNYDEVIRIQQSASMLLLLPHAGVKGIMTSKVFEYLGARKPILSVPGDGDVTDALLEETGAGVAAAEPAAIAELVGQWYRQWREGSDLPYGGKPDEIAKYTRRHQAQHTAKLLDEVCAARSNAE